MTNHPTSKPLIASIAIAALLIVIFVALGVIGGPRQTEPGNTAVGGKPLPAGAKTFKVAVQAADSSQSWQGVVQSRNLARLAPKLNARIVELLVQAGDRVKKGAVIAKLDDRDLRAAFDAASAGASAAEAQAAQAQAEQRRIVELYDKQAATRQNYDAVMAQAKAARAMASQAASAAQQAKVMLNENVILAPFDGVIGERLQQVGDMALPGQAIVTLYNPGELRLEAAIASQCSAQIPLHGSLQVRFDHLEQSVVGSVDEIAPDIEPQTHTRLVKVKLPASDGLRHGQFGWLQLSCQAERQALLIPVTAVFHYGQLQAVEVVENGRLLTRHIRTGKQYGDNVEVLSGLHAGETILADSERVL